MPALVDDFLRWAVHREARSGASPKSLPGAIARSVNTRDWLTTSQFLPSSVDERGGARRCSLAETWESQTRTAPGKVKESNPGARNGAFGNRFSGASSSVCVGDGMVVVTLRMARVCKAIGEIGCYLTCFSGKWFWGRVFLYHQFYVNIGDAKSKPVGLTLGFKRGFYKIMFLFFANDCGCHTLWRLRDIVFIRTVSVSLCSV